MLCLLCQQALLMLLATTFDTCYKILYPKSQPSYAVDWTTCNSTAAANRLFLLYFSCVRPNIASIPCFVWVHDWNLWPQVYCFYLFIYFSGVKWRYNLLWYVGFMSNGLCVRWWPGRTALVRIHLSGNKNGLKSNDPWGQQPIFLVSVDLVVSLSRNSTPQTSLYHLGRRNREVCEPCLALPPVSGVEVHSASIFIFYYSLFVLCLGFVNTAACNPSGFLKRGWVVWGPRP